MGRQGVVLAAIMWAMLPVGCGDDGNNTDGTGPIDAASEADARPTPVVDAAPASGTQQLGEFCELLQEGGPYCASELNCCDNEKVCREPADCQGSPGYLACTDGSGCPGGLLCCDIPSMRFCTKRSACAGYGGTEIP